MVARYNPCGRVVDIGRSTYRTKARLYPDSERLFEIEWYVAKADAPLLGYPSAINQLIWCRDHDEFQQTAVGEVPLAPWHKTRYRTPPLATGDHVCGTREDFGGMGQIDTTSPPVTYRPDGLPSCCGQLVEGMGGLGLGGTNQVEETAPILVRIDSSTGNPPVHTATRMTRDGGNNVVEYTPTEILTQVLNPDEAIWPDGALVQAYPIIDQAGWWWGEPVLTFAPSTTVNLSQDTSTDVVTAEVITQLSVTSDASGIKLVNDSTPPANRYYGTSPSAAGLGYQDVAAAVQAAAGNATTITAWQLALFGALPANGLVLIAGGGGVFIVGVDLNVAVQTMETLVNSTELHASNDAELVFTEVSRVYTNSFNQFGMIINRTNAGAVTGTDTITLVAGDGLDISSSAIDDTITFELITADSITADGDGLHLVGDETTPAAESVYGTSATGDRGWLVTDGDWLAVVDSTLSHIGPLSSPVTTVAYPVSVSYDARGHVSATTAGAQPVTQITTTDQSGGPLQGVVDFNGSAPIQLTVSGNTITIGFTGGGLGPAPGAAPTLTGTPGNGQIVWSWTTVTGATSYALSQGGATIYTGTGTTFTQTGLTNGTSYCAAVSGVNNGVLGPAGTACATPQVPPPANTTGVGTVANLPTNVTGGGLLLLCTYGFQSNPISGWTQINSSSDGAQDWNACMYIKASDGSTSVTLALASAWSTYYMLTKSAADPAAANADGSTPGPIVAPSTAPSVTGGIRICMWCRDQSSGFGNTTLLTPPGTFTLSPLLSSSGQYSMVTGSQQLSASGATGTATATCAPNYDSWGGVSCVFK